MKVTVERKTARTRQWGQMYRRCHSAEGLMRAMFSVHQRCINKPKSLLNESCFTIKPDSLYFSHACLDLAWRLLLLQMALLLLFCSIPCFKIKHWCCVIASFSFSTFMIHWIDRGLTWTNVGHHNCHSSGLWDFSRLGFFGVHPRLGTIQCSWTVGSKKTYLGAFGYCGL